MDALTPLIKAWPLLMGILAFVVGYVQLKGLASENKAKIERLRTDHEREIAAFRDALSKDRADTEKKRDVLHIDLAQMREQIALTDRAVSVFTQISNPDRLQAHYTEAGRMSERVDTIRRDLDKMLSKKADT